MNNSLFYSYSTRFTNIAGLLNVASSLEFRMEKGFIRLSLLHKSRAAKLNVPGRNRNHPAINGTATGLT